MKIIKTMNKLIVAALLLLSASGASQLYAQNVSGRINSILKSGNIRDDIKINPRPIIRSSIRDNIKYNSSTQLSTNQQTSGPKTAKAVGPDYVLYKDVVRRNLWLEGRGEPISQETANRLPCYYKLSMKNDKGHYQFVQAMRGNDVTTEHDVSTYIWEKKPIHDSIANECDARFSTIGQWLITSDLAGDRVVEERAYEAKNENANLVYAFQPIYNDSIHVTGTYTDSWGLPIDINGEDSRYYGSVVYITLNKQGLDSIIDHVDAKGLCRYNEYGVDQTRYIYDDQDRIISISSHNTVGDRVNDNRGFCATLYEYSDYDNSCVVTHLDKNLLPVAPSKAIPGQNFKKRLIRFDEIGCKEEQQILE